MEQTMSNEERAKTLPEQLRLLYSSCVAEIAGFKGQQWKTTNNALLVYAAIVSIAKTIETLSHVGLQATRMKPRAPERER
jgi:uncharacterized membrane protein